MTTVIEPVKLTGLKQANYVMDCLIAGQSASDIALVLGDDQLLEIWISFLIHNRWMSHERDGWTITAKGAEWKNRLKTRA